MQLYSEWAVAPSPDESRVQAVARGLNISTAAASLLVARGCVTVEQARAFLHGDLAALHEPELLPDLPAALARLGRALDEGEQIGIYGDYDVDGQTSTALLVRGLRALGADPLWYIPERVAEGYGLNRQAIETLADKGVKLLVTVDCGSGAVDEVERAVELGMDVIITDHHEPGDEHPPAVAFVNPKRLDSAYPFRELAGVGVAWKLMQALWRSRGRSGLSPHGLELTAMGTVADVCPLVSENRIIVKEGLARINGDAMPALSALAEVCGVERGQVDATRVAFGLAPRLNAAGRVGHAEVGVRLLLCDDFDEAKEIAQRLDSENRRRRDIEAQIVDEAMAAVEAGDMLSDWVLVVAGEGWHPGVIGIVASRLVERYARPAVVIGLDGDAGTGSGRSIEPFDLYAGLSGCAPLLERFGGHAMAAGLTVRRDRVDALRRALNEHAADVLQPSDLVPRTRVDLALSLADVTEGLARELEMLAPFGAGNPTPVLAAEGALVVASRLVGREAEHLKLTLKDPEGDSRVWEAMAFGGGGLFDAVPPGSEVQAAFTLRLGQWRGRNQLTLALRSLQSPLAVAERRAAVAGKLEKVSVDAFVPVRGRPVPVADRRHRAAVHPLARAAYVAPLADTGARIVAVIGPGDEQEALAGSLGHALQVEVSVAEGETFVPRSRVYVLDGEAVAAWDLEGASGRKGPTERWEGRGHLVFFGLPATESAMWSLLVQAAAAPGWSVHLAYDTGGVEASARALSRRFPGKQSLRVLYRALQSLAGQDGVLPPSPRIVAYVESRRLGLFDAEGIEHGLAVFAELGLVADLPGGLRLVPQDGRKVDVDSSGRYNNGIRIQRQFAAYSRIALAATPARLLALAAERGPLDGFAFAHQGSA